MNTLLKGGSVVSGQGCRRLDVLLEGERVAAVGASLPQGDARVVNCAGTLLFPGFIDGHTHFDLHVAGTVTADDFATGSRAACGAAPPRSLISPPRKRGRPWPMAWPAGGRRRRAGRPVTTAST